MYQGLVAHSSILANHGRICSTALGMCRRSSLGVPHTSTPQESSTLFSPWKIVDSQCGHFLHLLFIKRAKRRRFNEDCQELTGHSTKTQGRYRPSLSQMAQTKSSTVHRSPYASSSTKTQGRYRPSLSQMAQTKSCTIHHRSPYASSTKTQGRYRPSLSQMAQTKSCTIHHRSPYASSRATPKKLLFFL